MGDLNGLGMFQLEKIYTSWTPERILRHLFYWGAWTLFYSSVNSTYSHTMGKWILAELAILTIKIPFTYAVIYYLVPRFLVRKQYLQFFAISLVFAVIAGNLLHYCYDLVIYPQIFEMENKWGKKLYFLIMDLIYVASLPTIFKLLQRQMQQEKLTSQIAEQKLDAELKLLKNQLHPHFLFNTLNNLYGMVLTQHPNAADVVIRLSDMLSYMLYECDDSITPMEKEIENLNNYIELEKIRYGKRLDIVFESGGNYQGKVLAPLLLIPFVENAFKHGVEKTETKAWIRMNLWVEGSRLKFLIENSLPSEKEQDLRPNTQSGIGLKNVRKRLELLYPERHQLEIRESETFLVQLNIDLDDELPNR